MRLIVSIAHVESRIEFLDQLYSSCSASTSVFTTVLDLRRGGDHLTGARMQAGDVGEIRIQPGWRLFALPT